MCKFRIVRRIRQARIVAVIRSDNADTAFKTSEASIEGGVSALGISFATPDVLESNKTLSKRHADHALIGAGTALDSETARLAVLARSAFILSPSLNKDAAHMCGRYQVVSMPGAATAAEAVRAMETGAGIVEVFPGEAFGPGCSKALRAPLPHAPLMPSGGVTLENAKDWFDQGAGAIGVGSSLTGPSSASDFAGVAQRARQYVQRVQNIPHQMM